MSDSFDRSGYVVVKNNASRRRNSQHSLRRRSGSFGELQPTLDRQESNDCWEFTAKFDNDDVVTNNQVVMMERYDYFPRRRQQNKPLTGKDFMDGRDFLNSTNLFHDSHASQRWHSQDAFLKDEEHETQQQEEELNDLFQELHVNTGMAMHRPLPQHKENHEPEVLFPWDYSKEVDDFETEPTAPATEPTTTTPSSSSNGELLAQSNKHKPNSKHKKKRKEKKRSKRKTSTRLPSVVPPKEIDVSDHVTVASSVGGTSPIRRRPTISPPTLTSVNEQDEQCLLPRAPVLYTKATPKRTTNSKNTPATPRVVGEVDVSALMTVASSIGQESAWNNNKLPSRIIDISAPMTVQSSLGGDSFVHRKKRLDLEKIHSHKGNAVVKEIDVSDPTVVSSLGASQRRLDYQALPSEKFIYPRQHSTSLLHHQLYHHSSDNC